MIILLFISLFFISLFLPVSAHAIVVLPALILIPIAKILAVVIASLIIPITSLGILIKYFTKNRKQAILISFLLLILISVITFIILRITYPDNPLI